MDKIDVLISDSTIIKLRLVAAKQLVLENEDRDFPEGIYLEFYDEQGLMTSTLEANTGYYFSKDDFYRAEGNVIMQSKTSKDELTTELLKWVPKVERSHTDNFVTIVTEEDVLTGEGLEATQDFGEYTILKPTGTMQLNGSKKKIKNDDEFDEELEYVEDTITYD